MKSLREQLQPLRGQVTSARVFAQLSTLTTAQLRRMLNSADKHIRPHRPRIYEELRRRRTA